MPGGIRRGLVLNAGWILFGAALLIPLFDLALPRDYQFTGLMRPIFIFAILGLGLNVVTGYTGC